MIVATDRMLFAPQVFAKANTIRAAAKSTPDGLNIDSGLGGSYYLKFTEITADGKLAFLQEARTDWPERHYTFTPREATRQVYALHPASPFHRERKLPLGAVACVYCRLDHILAMLKTLMPEGAAHATLTTSVGSLTVPLAKLMASDTLVSDLLKNGMTDVRKNHLSLANYPICFIALTDDEMEASRLNGSPTPFTFHELTYELRCTRLTF